MYVVCYLLHVAWYMLHAMSYVFRVVCCVLYVAVLRVMCNMVIRCVSCVVCREKFEIFFFLMRWEGLFFKVTSKQGSKRVSKQACRIDLAFSFVTLFVSFACFFVMTLPESFC